MDFEVIDTLFKTLHKQARLIAELEKRIETLEAGYKDLEAKEVKKAA